jgi:hypothetical protein
MSGVFVYASKVGETEAEVRYEVRQDRPEAPVRCVLIIPKDDPDELWRVEGEATSRALASLVVGRAIRLHRERGSWPERVAKQ